MFKIDLEKKLVTGPVIIANEADAEDDRITPEEIERVMHTYMRKYRNVEYAHTLKNIATPVECYQLQSDINVTPLYSEDPITIPAGSWIMTSYIEEDQVLQKIQNGELQGYSVFAIPDKLANPEIEGEGTVPISQLGNDWEVIAVAMVKEPKMNKAMFYAAKGHESLKDKAKKFVLKLVSKKGEDEKILKVGNMEITKEELAELMGSVVEEKLKEHGLIGGEDPSNPVDEAAVKGEGDNPEEEVPAEEQKTETDDPVDDEVVDEAAKKGEDESTDEKDKIEEVKTEVESIKEEMNDKLDEVLSATKGFTGSNSIHIQKNVNSKKYGTDRDAFGRKMSS